MSFVLCFPRLYSVSWKLTPKLTKFITDFPFLRKASIDEDRKSGLLDLSSMFDHVLARFLQYSAGWSRSDARLIKVGHVLQELYDLNIWPISTRLNEINMDRIQSTFALFSEPDDTSFNRDLNTKILAAVDAQKGLCLSCVRIGKISSHQGNCHSRVRYLCTR